MPWPPAKHPKNGSNQAAHESKSPASHSPKAKPSKQGNATMKFNPASSAK